MTKDLTTGKAESVLWKFCIPLFASVIFQQLYNIADSLVAGKFIGENALAAVGNSYEITLIFIAISFGCNIGCSVIVSQLFGAGNYKSLKTAVYTTFISSGVICVILMTLGLIFSKALLNLINTPSEIAEISKIYLDIYILGLPFVLFYNVSTGIFSALGDSKTPFIFLMISSIANILMDVLFVKAFSNIFTHGVDAVAWATFICQGFSCIFALYVVIKKLKSFNTDSKPDIFSFKILKEISKIAVPSALQQSFISIGNIVIQGIINSFGTGVIAGYSATVKLNNLVITSFTTLGNGISNFTAQNIGAKKYERIKEGYKAGIKLVLILCTVPAVTYFFFGQYLISFFLDSPTEDALKTGITFLRLLAPFYFVISSKLVSDGVLRGSGQMGYFMTATFTDLIVRVIFAKVLSLTSLGSFGIWLGWPIGWIVGTILSLIFYNKCKKVEGNL